MAVLGYLGQVNAAFVLGADVGLAARGVCGDVDKEGRP